MKKINLAFLIFSAVVFSMGCANNSQTEQFSEVPDTGTSESTVGFTETTAEVTTTAESDTTPSETTTTFDDAAPGFFGVFPGRIMLDGELREIYPLDALTMIETEDGYSSIDPLLPDTEEHLSALLTDENLRGISKKVTDEAEKNGTEYLIQNELETDFFDGMKVYFDGEDARLLIKHNDTDRNYLFNTLDKYEYQQKVKKEDPEAYKEMEEKGEAIMYDIPNLDLDKIWYAFFLDPSV